MIKNHTGQLDTTRVVVAILIWLVPIVIVIARCTAPHLAHG